MAQRARRTLNLAQVVKMTGCSRRSIYNWVYSKKVEGLQTSKGLRIYEDSLISSIQSETIKPRTVELQHTLTQAHSPSATQAHTPSSGVTIPTNEKDGIARP